MEAEWIWPPYARVRRLGTALVAAAVLIPGAAAAQLARPVEDTPPFAPLPAGAAAHVVMPAARALEVRVPVPRPVKPSEEPASVSVTTDVAADNGRRRRVSFTLPHVTADVLMEFDLADGVITVDGGVVADFPPVSPLTDNLRLPVDVTIHRGAGVVTARGDIDVLLPTVIVPGFSNEWRSQPDPLVVDRFARFGYTAAAPPTLFWFSYPSHTMGFEEAVHALAAYVRRVVLPATYAAKINVVGYSVGALLARWDLQYDVDGWSSLVNRLVMVAAPNEGTVMPYIGEHVPSFIPFVQSARSPLARAMDPVFPFWRAAPADPWAIPSDGGNPLLSALNGRPVPKGIRLYNVYGSNDPSRTGGPQTAAALTGLLPGAVVTYGAGDGIILAASALGLSINGSPGVPALADRAVRVEVGRVYHTRVLETGAAQVAAALQDRFETVEQAAAPAQHASTPR